MAFIDPCKSHKPLLLHKTAQKRMLCKVFTVTLPAPSARGHLTPPHLHCCKSINTHSPFLRSLRQENRPGDQ